MLLPLESLLSYLKSNRSENNDSILIHALQKWEHLSNINGDGRAHSQVCQPETQRSNILTPPDEKKTPQQIAC